MTRFDSSEFDTKIAGEIKDLEVTDYIDRKEARRMDRFSHFAVIAADKAVEDSGIDFTRWIVSFLAWCWVRASAA